MEISIMYYNTEPTMTMVEKLTKNLETISNFINYITHPKLILMALWNCIIEYSYIVCLFIMLSGIITKLIMGKEDKHGNTMIKLSILIYLIINILDVIVR